jgi:hypothetical protein
MWAFESPGQHGEMTLTSINYLAVRRWKAVGTEAEFRGH